MIGIGETCYQDKNKEAKDEEKIKQEQSKEKKKKQNEKKRKAAQCWLCATCRYRMFLPKLDNFA